MAFIGTPLDTRNTFQSLQGKRFDGDGSTTAFTLDVAPSSTLDIEVFVGNVRQDPNSAYTLSGTTLTFTGAPPSGTNNIYVVHQAKAVGTIGIPDDTISARTLVTLDNSADHVLIEDATDGALKKALIPGASFAGIDDQSSSNDDQLTITDTAVVINEDSDDVDFRVESNSNTHMFFIDGGNNRVGMVTTPDLGTGLHIRTADSGGAVEANADELVVEGSGNTGISILSGTSNVGAVHFNDSGGNERGAFKYNHNADELQIKTGGTERMRLKSNGYLGVTGTAGSGIERRLSVYGSHVSEDGLVWIQTSNGSGDDNLVLFFDGNTNNCGEITLDASGNTVAYVTSSDYRLKQNATDISDGITRLKQLKPYRFQWKSDPDKTVDGFFAHEAQEIVPESVKGTKDAMKTAENVVVNADGSVECYNIAEADWEQGKIDGKYASNSTWQASKSIIDRQGIDQSKLVPLLTAALKEAITEIESLKARVTTLEG